MSEYQSKSNTKDNKKTSSESVSKETQTSFEDATYDFSPEVMALKSLQTAADNSPRSNSITQLQAMADAGVEFSYLDPYKDKKTIRDFQIT